MLFSYCLKFSFTYCTEPFVQVWSCLQCFDLDSILFYSVLQQHKGKYVPHTIIVTHPVPQFNLHPFVDIFNSLIVFPKQTVSDRVMESVVAVHCVVLCCVPLVYYISALSILVCIPFHPDMLCHVLLLFGAPPLYRICLFLSYSALTFMLSAAFLVSGAVSDSYWSGVSG